MAFTHGRNTVFKLDNSSGVLTDLSAFLTNVSFPETIDTHEATVFGKASKAFVVGLKSSTISLSGHWDPTLDAHLGGVKGLAGTVTFEYGPEGGAVGKVKYSGEAVLTSYEKTSPVGDIVNFTAALQVSDDVVRGAF